MNPAVLGAATGLVGGGGGLLALARLPMGRRPTLVDRLAPYLRDAPRPSTLLVDTGHDVGALLAASPHQSSQIWRHPSSG